MITPLKLVAKCEEAEAWRNLQPGTVVRVSFGAAPTWLLKLKPNDPNSPNAVDLMTFEPRWITEDTVVMPYEYPQLRLTS